MSIEYKTPRRIQRLKRPTDETGSDPMLGFNSAALKALSKVFTFDYMGNNDFESGELPKAFGTLFEKVQSERYRAGEMNVHIKAIDPPWSRDDRVKETTEVTVYVIALDSIYDRFCDFIRSEAAGERNNLIEITFFQTSCLEDVYGDELYKLMSRRGWFDLDNSAFFFIDEDMYEKARKNLGLGSGPDAAPQPRLDQRNYGLS